MNSSNNNYDELIRIFSKYDCAFEENTIDILKREVIQSFVLLTQDIVVWLKAYNQAFKLDNIQIALFLTRFMNYKFKIEIILEVLNFYLGLNEDFLSSVYLWSIFDYSIAICREEAQTNSMLILDESAKVILPFVKIIDNL